MAENNPPRIGRGNLILKAIQASKQPGLPQQTPMDTRVVQTEDRPLPRTVGRGSGQPTAVESPRVGQSLPIVRPCSPAQVTSFSLAKSEVGSSALSSRASSGYISPQRNIEVAASSSGESKSSGGGRGLRFANLIKQNREAAAIHNVGRGAIGRSDLLQSLKKEPRSVSGSDSGESSQEKSLAGSVAQLNISSEEEHDVALTYHGSTGSKFEASCNYIRIALNSEKAVFEYEVKFHPQIDAKNLRFSLLNSVREKIGNTKSFDGAKLWLPIQLPSVVTKLQTLCKHTGENITIIITYKSKTTLAKSIQLYNVLFNRVLKVLQMVMIGRNYFSPMSAVMVPQHKLEIWPGFVTSAQQMEGGLMLCVDVSHRILRSNTVYSVMEVFFRTSRDNPREAIKKALIGNVVLTRYNNKCYRIDDILFDQNPQSTFQTSRGEDKSYIQYYNEAYKIDINDPRQPLLVHKLRKKEQKDANTDKLICLIPELCFMTGLTDELRSDFRVMKDLASHTRITPVNRQACLRKFIRNVNDTPEARAVLADWGLVLLDDTVQLQGRIAPSEPIIFDSRQVDNVQNADWGREACRERVLQPVDLKMNMWALMFVARDEQKAKKFAETLRQCSSCMGIAVGEPKIARLPNDNSDSYVRTIRELYHDKLQIIVIIFPTQREDRYSAVKRICSGELGIPSQCINSRTISQDAKLRSVTQKIALQINCKLGGELWSLKIPMSGLMVCGVDVYHDPLRKGGSVVAFVASLNQSVTRWYSYANFQRPGDEVIHGMKIAMLEALRNYHEENHSMPKSIVIYRDGVSDGMIDLTKEHEIPQIASIFRNFESYEPKLYFVVVQKRINTRIFANLSGSVSNPPPGSIVDHTITKRKYYDFLLVSQHVRQGTVSPTHYVVIHDGGGLKPDNMQRLTYKMTHLYYNWPGTIRVPAPCQYAHKLAYLVGQNMRKEPHPCLGRKLHFL